MAARKDGRAQSLQKGVRERDPAGHDSTQKKQIWNRIKKKLNDQASGQVCTDSRPMLLDRVDSSFRQYKEALIEFYHADRTMCVTMYLIHDMQLSVIMKDKVDAVHKAMEEKKERGQSAE